MKEVRLKNKITGGPQSHILEGVTWEEMNKLQDQKNADQVFLVGAASKGIIQREFQHNAMVYKSAYAKNPFDNVTDQELEEYKQYVEKKQRGEPVDDVPDSVKHLLIEPIAPTQDIASPTSPTSPLSDEEGIYNFSLFLFGDWNAIGCGLRCSFKLRFYFLNFNFSFVYFLYFRICFKF